jgi:hypothetical protein
MAECSRMDGGVVMYRVVERTNREKQLRLHSYTTQMTSRGYRWGYRHGKDGVEGYEN